MAFWKYKPTQGYWTRTLSLIGAMAMVAAGAGWIASELPTYSVSRSVTVSIPGQTILSPDLTGLGVRLRQPEAKDLKEDPQLAIEVAAVTNRSPAKRFDVLLNDRIVSVNDQSIESAEQLTAALAQTDLAKPTTLGVLRKKSIKEFVQGGVAAVMIVGALVYFLYLFNKPGPCEFLIATEAEMKKVNWPSRKELLGSTWLVIAGTFMLALMLYVFDFVFLVFFKMIGVIKV